MTTRESKLMLSSFRPPNASSSRETKSIVKSHLPSSLDLSTTSSTASAALAGLTSEDVALIDEIIERAPSSATTFLTVFRAYNEVLQERGMDSGDDVVYYRMLLKLGVVKGKDWGEKWKAVKSQLGYGSTPAVARHQAPRKPPRTESLQPAGPSKPRHVPRDSDTFTVHSHLDTVENEDATPDFSLFHDGDGTSDISTPNALGLRMETRTYPTIPSIQQFLPVGSAGMQAHKETASSVSRRHLVVPSPKPPSYQSATRGARSRRFTELSASEKVVQSRDPPRPRECMKSAINEDEAWKKVKIAHDERIAIQYCDDKLLERCWLVWRENLDWIITTSKQLDLARKNIILRRSLRQWQEKFGIRNESYRQVASLADSHFLRVKWNAWKKRVRAKRMMEWREDMRNKMTMIKEKRYHRLIQEVWTKWRQTYLSTRLQRYHDIKICARAFSHWKHRLQSVERLESLADQFMNGMQQQVRSSHWEAWKAALVLREKEKHVCSSSGLRLQAKALDTWKLRMREHHKAQAFNEVYVMKRVFRMWRSTLSRICSREQKAEKYRARQGTVLVRAVMRVWVARERGILLHRVRNARLVQDVWTAWNQRQIELKSLEARALKFEARSSTVVVVNTIDKWRQVLSTHRNAHAFAVRYHNDQLLFRMLQIWRIKLRLKLRMVKQARIARRYLLARHAWNVWRDRMDARQREKALRAFEVKLLAKKFQKWHQLASRRQYHRDAAQIVERGINLRTMKHVVRVWTTRVIELKLRELEVVERRDNALMTYAFAKWKAVCSRHAEDISLMQSYQDVKREETMRRMFHRWLSAARKVHHRRVTLQEREDEVKAVLLTEAWEKWRERLQDQRLRPLEIGLVIQLQKNLLFRAFGVWHSKTKSGPAIRFHSSHVKAKHWRIWREAMPKALLAKEARQFERKAVLTRALDKWVKTYRTKVAMKAVARARYLRLPSGLPNVMSSATTSAVSRSSLYSVPSNKSARSTSPAKSDLHRRPSRGPEAGESIPSQSPEPYEQNNRGALPMHIGQSRLSAAAKANRERADLWLELRDAKKRTCTGTERSKSVTSR